MGLVLFEKRGHIAYLTLNRPEQLNALSRQLAEELVHTLQEMEKDPEIWVGIITGAGEKSFCAGADLKDTGHSIAPEEWEARFVQDLLEVKKPMIAAVNGYCLGVGFAIALSCDLRISTENAAFGTPDQKINTVDSYAALILSHYIPSAIAMEMLFTGEMVSAEEAYRVGLVNRVVPKQDLMSSTEQMASKVLRNGPLALRACKELSRRGRTMPFCDGLALFKALAANVLSSEDTIEGVQAFLEKREPVWKCK